AGGGKTVQHRHPDVHQHHLRLVLPRQRRRLGTVLGFRHDRDVAVVLAQDLQPGTHQFLVVGEHHPDGHRTPPAAGRYASTAKPPPPAGPLVRLPPRAATRSDIPRRPEPARSGEVGEWPRPSSRTVSRIPSGVCCTRTLTERAWAWRSVLVNDSCTSR